MSKKSYAIIKAYHRGAEDRRLGKPYLNPYSKSRERDKHKAYKNGYNDA